MSHILHGTYRHLSSGYLTEETNINLSVPHTLPHLYPPCLVLTHSDGSHVPPSESQSQPWIPPSPAFSVLCTIHSPSPLCIFNFWSLRGLLLTHNSTCSSLPQFFKPSLDPPIPLPVPSLSGTLNDVITFPQLPHLPVSCQLPAFSLSPPELRDTAPATIIHDLLGTHFSSAISLSVLRLPLLGFSDTKFSWLLLVEAAPSQFAPFPYTLGF